MAFLDLVSELVGTLPGLSPFLAETHINRAYEEIRGERLWSFLITDGAVVCPAVITAGSVSITQFSNQVTLNAAASAAIASQLPGSAVPGILQLQIRFTPGTLGIANQVYSIVDFDDAAPAAVILTLDRVVQEATSATSAYQLYRCYVVPPIPDFLRWQSFTDPTNGTPPLKMDYTSRYFDCIDPQRQAQGMAYYIGSYAGARIADPVTGAVVPNATVDAGTPIYELWPHPVQGQTFYVRFHRRGDNFLQPTDVQPDGISSGMIIQRALGWHTYQWAMANVAHYPTFKGVNFGLLINAARKYYDEELLAAKREDNNKQLQDVWYRGHGLRQSAGFKGDHAYPIDANFLQSHLVRF